MMPAANPKPRTSTRRVPSKGSPAPSGKRLEPLPVVDQVQACCPDLLAGPLSDEDAEVAARLFKALADPARVKLISMIAAAEGQEVCVCDLVDVLDLAQPTVSHHLKVLLDAGLLERERRASWAFYRLRPGALTTAARALGGVC